MRTLLSLVSGLLFVGAGFGQTRYPNELPGYAFYSRAQWRALKPLVSTIDDVRKIMGKPYGASDNASYSEAYPGDALVRQPVFTYRLGPDWEMLVYFVSSCPRKVPRDVPPNRVCSFDLIPRKHVSFRKIEFPGVFAKQHIIAVDAQWDEYSDGTGLRYEVYTTKTPYGGNGPGDLNRISYGPPESAPKRGP